MLKRFILSTIVALSFSSSVDAQTANGRVTGSAPTYGANTASPLSLDTSGNLRTTGTFTGSVTITGSLPAGTNNIGDVDVLTLPSLPAGTNNIGDVDVLTLPALPAGNNNIGDVDVLTLPALPAGSNTIGSINNAAVNSAAISLNATTTPVVYRNTSGTLDWIVMSNPGAALTVTLYDNASACTGTVKFAGTLVLNGQTINMPFSQPISFANGLTGCTNTSAASVTVGYR